MEDDNNAVDEPTTLSIEGPSFFKIGFWLTLIYVGAVVGFSLWDWIDVALMKPNEWGDFLAGVFGPLALLWVVLGFLQQGSELRYSRDALVLQAQELQNSVVQQKALVVATREQIDTDREALEEERRGKLQALQPAFILQTYSPHDVIHGDYGATIAVNLELINFGAAVTNVKLLVDCDLIVAGPKNHQAAIMRESDSIEFSLYFDRDKGVAETEVSLTFILADGSEDQRKFFLLLRNDRLEPRDHSGNIK